ncbi:hypothetical protein GOBAR_DD11486 [Gossypium barbadense]|nr:hypothetical protein GOBAR_DD11486 [Gossypium barbadense]
MAPGRPFICPENGTASLYARKSPGTRCRWGAARIAALQGSPVCDVTRGSRTLPSPPSALRNIRATKVRWCREPPRSDQGRCGRAPTSQGPIYRMVPSPLDDQGSRFRWCPSSRQHQAAKVSMCSSSAAATKGPSFRPMVSELPQTSQHLRSGWMWPRAPHRPRPLFGDGCPRLPHAKGFKFAAKCLRIKHQGARLVLEAPHDARAWRLPDSVARLPRHNISTEGGDGGRGPHDQGPLVCRWWSPRLPHDQPGLICRWWPEAPQASQGLSLPMVASLSARPRPSWPMYARSAAPRHQVRWCSSRRARKGPGADMCPRLPHIIATEVPMVARGTAATKGLGCAMVCRWARGLPAATPGTMLTATVHPEAGPNWDGSPSTAGHGSPEHHRGEPNAAVGGAPDVRASRWAWACPWRQTPFARFQYAPPPLKSLKIKTCSRTSKHPRCAMVLELPHIITPRCRCSEAPTTKGAVWRGGVRMLPHIHAPKVADGLERLPHIQACKVSADVAEAPTQSRATQRREAAISSFSYNSGYAQPGWIVTDTFFKPNCSAPTGARKCRWWLVARPYNSEARKARSRSLVHETMHAGEAVGQKIEQVPGVHSSGELAPAPAKAPVLPMFLEVGRQRPGVKLTRLTKVPAPGDAQGRVVQQN